jgi:hypothetical protein
MWDTQILCYSYDWYVHAVYAGVFTLVYIIGVPKLFLILLLNMRNAFVKENALEISVNEKMKKKFLRLTKADHEERGHHWTKIKNRRDELNRISSYLQRLNLRDERNRSRLGFLYRFYKEEYFWFEMFEFIFKLCMTGIMVHIAPGTVSQILVGMLITFFGFGLHMAAKPYREDSNNVLMIFGKFQLFLTLFGALLLKMETPFFGNDSQMQELDVQLLSKMIIYSTVMLLVVWILTLGHDIYTFRRKIAEAKAMRIREQETKRRFTGANERLANIRRLSRSNTMEKSRKFWDSNVSGNISYKRKEEEQTVDKSIKEIKNPIVADNNEKKETIGESTVCKESNSGEIEKKQNDVIDSKLRKLGIPSTYISITALIVFYVCSTIGACD